MDQKTAPASSSPFLLLRFSNEHIALSDMGRIKKTFPFLNFLSFDNKSKVLVKIEHTLSEEITLNEVSLGKSPTINFTLMRSHFLFSNCQ